MSSIASQYDQNVHQIGNTVAWSIILNVAILCAALRHDRLAALAHAIFGFIILILTFICVLFMLSLYGFNANTLGWEYYAHGILGLLLLGFITIQVAGGITYKLLRQSEKFDIFKLRFIRNLHQAFAYFLAIIYKINIIICWWGSYVAPTLILWQFGCIIAYILIKTVPAKLEAKVTDSQTEGFLCPEIKSTRALDKLTDKYIIFGNYAYDAADLKAKHPGGYRVIELVLGREVDRFLYGMYSAELYPELLPYSHSASCLQLVGNPIAKIVTPPTFRGFEAEICEAEIRYLCEVSGKTQIYAIGLVQKSLPFTYLGYSDVRQLGQFYSLTIDSKTTRLYTAVNFLTSANLELMSELLELPERKQFKTLSLENQAKVEFQLQQIRKNNVNSLTEKFQPQRQHADSEEYLPLMLKVYDNGKLTAALKRAQFRNSVRLSAPRGKGLELESTRPGRIIIVTGGTGLFPFSDLVDLLYKSRLVEQKHPQAQLLLENDPILAKRPFAKFEFTFLIALNEPEDIHAVTLSQLVRLSEGRQSVKTVLRVSKNADKLQGKLGSIEFTRDYFTKRVLSEAAKEGLSRVWICGPPKLNTDTGKVLIENGYSRETILFL